MVIQELLFPEIGKCTVEEMYFRKDNGKTTSFGPDPLREEMNRRVKAEERFQNEERVHIFGEKQEIAFEQ